jgi:iron complex transport system substrate-binding protein
MNRALVLCFAALLSCKARTPATAPVATRAVEDGMHRQLFVRNDAARIVSLAPSSTEILFALGVGAHVVGVDNFSNYPAATASLPRLGSNLEPALERIEALRPDVVFTATSANNQQTTDALQHFGIPVFVSRSESLDDVYADIAAIARAVDKAAAGARISTELRDDLIATRARVAGAQPTRVAIVVWPDPLIVAGGRSHVGALIDVARGINIAGDDAQPFPNFSLERLIASRTDVLVLGSHSQGAAQLGSLARIDAIPAVHNHRVYELDGDLLFRPGPRLGLAARELAAILHPELFPDGDAHD